MGIERRRKGAGAMFEKREGEGHLKKNVGLCVGLCFIAMIACPLIST